MNLNELTPAPWESSPGFGEVKGPWCKETLRRMQVVVQDRQKPSPKADLDFIALARNAFDGDPEALAWWEANRKKPPAPSQT